MDRKAVLEMLRRESEFYASHTVRQYFSHVTNYLDFVGPNRDWHDRDVLYNYTQKLKKLGKSQAHINYIIRGPIGALFRAEGLRIPIKLPRVKVAGSIIDLLSRVAYTSEEIIALIQAARQGTGQEKAVFAVATIYGPRVGEIQMVKPEDVHPKKKTIIIHTEKGGYWREHLVPEEIQSYVFGYGWMPISHNVLYQVFNEVAKRAGVDRKPRKVFHAIRHGVFSALIHEAEIPEKDAYEFMRWKMPGMIGVYSPYDPKNDKKVIPLHPFLKYWEG